MATQIQRGTPDHRKKVIDGKHDSISYLRSKILYPSGYGKGRVLFTGPDGIRNHKVNVLQPGKYIGIGIMSPEGTSELSYLWRPATPTRYPLSKSKSVGEIGWNIASGITLEDRKRGKPLLRGEFRQLCEDRQTHAYQNPWVPHPHSKEYKIDRLGREFIYRPHDRHVLSSEKRCGCLSRPKTSQGLRSIPHVEQTVIRPFTSYRKER